MFTGENSYPNNDASGSQILLRKLIDTCSKKVAKHVKKCRTNKKQNGKELKWKYMSRVLKINMKVTLQVYLSSAGNSNWYLYVWLLICLDKYIKMFGYS